MSLPISTKPPIVVIVRDGMWKAYSAQNPATEWDQYLFGLLESMGGINEEVAPGAYHFNAAPLDETNVVVQLDPIRGWEGSRIFHAL